MKKKGNVFDEMDAKENTGQFPEWKRKIADQVENGAVMMVMMVITIWALFGDDIKYLTTDTSSQPAFEGITIFCLVTFTLELVALSVCKKDYIFGFYFWLDLIATASLILDIQAVNDALFSTSSDGGGGGGTGDSATLARASRTSRAGTKAGRIVRLVRLVRIVKLYKQWTMKKEERERAKLGGLMDDDLVELEESRVGKKLSELTTRRVIIGVLAMLVLLPMFEADFQPPSNVVLPDEWHRESIKSLTETWLQPCHKGTTWTVDDPTDIGPEYSYSELQTLFERGAPYDDVVGCNSACEFDSESTWVKSEYDWRGCTTIAFQKALDLFCDNADGSVSQGDGVFGLVGDDFPAGGAGPCADKKIINLLVAVDSEEQEGAFVVKDVDRLEKLRSDEINGGSYRTKVFWSDKTYGSRVTLDAKDLAKFGATLSILRTIFVTIVLGAGALLFSNDANRLVLTPIERIIKRVRDIAENPLAAQDKQAKTEDQDQEEQFEMVILENSINKICSLLAIGFGEAGAEIIGENMRSGGDLNPMVPGRKMVAIFGFCDIRQFTDATEVLQEGVMEYVNSIGEIVHGEVSMHGGSANKNIGDAFLLVWKFPEHITLEQVEDVVFNGAKCPGGISEVADKALASFVVIMAALRKSERLAEYRKNDALNERIPNFEVKMGFGLHVGWAIEGAIGSAHKIDASYLSPNVNMAARLEAATKQFGTPLLLSQDFVSILSPKAESHVREIDAVTVKGSTRPIGLYTFDVHTADIPPQPDAPSASRRIASMADEFTEHPDILSVQAGDPAFKATFKRGFAAYKKGDWPTARAELEKTLEMISSGGSKALPGPSEGLLRVMEGHGYQAPASWKGFRELTEK